LTKEKSVSSIHVWTPGIREGTGGIQALSRFYISALRKAFPEARIEVFVKNDTADNLDPLRGDNILFHSASSYPPFLRTFAFALLGLFHGLKNNPQLALSTHLNFLPAMVPLGWFRKTPIACILHGIEAWTPLQSVSAAALRSADLLISVSNFTQSTALRLHDLDARKMRVIPNTFDIGKFAPGPKPGELLDRYRLSPDQPVLLSVSRLADSERYKGQIEVIQALPTIAMQFPNIRYLIGGQGPFARTLSKLAEQLDVADLVIFAGFIPNEELTAHYQLCDVFVMPSQKEGFGIVFLEAMACGKPVIAGNLDGSVDALDGGRLGALVNPADHAQIASTVIDILSGNYPNRLLFNPNALHDRVVQTFGSDPFNARVHKAIAPVLKVPVGSAPPYEPLDIRIPTSTSPCNPHDCVRHSVTVLTQLTSPYQVEFFNHIAKHEDCDLSVVYLTNHDPNRQWSTPNIQHRHLILSDTQDSGQVARRWLEEADLAVFNYYTHPFALSAIHRRNASRKPWVFWGERPGAILRGWPISIFRHLALMPLSLGQSPIWGIGQFAIDGYKSDFGDARLYRNLPYFSNLERFRKHARNPEPGTIRFLFSGTLSKRKGTDLLAKAFLQLALKHPHARLTLVGVGPLESKIRSILASVSNQVEFKGFTPWQDLPKAYACADVFCFPSRYDGWGLALVEAMASSLPVISTPLTGSAREFVSENINGWIIPPGDETALHQAMLNALTAPLAIMGQTAALAVSNHTLEQGACRFLDAAHEALKPSGCTPQKGMY
jgi:glycosyltransferase involved in cell wall biosynthesis